MKKELGMAIDWSKAEKDDYLPAIERSPIKDAETKAPLKAALTDKTDDREIYMKSIDQRYNYEGCNVFRLEDLYSL